LIFLFPKIKSENQIRKNKNKNKNKIKLIEMVKRDTPGYAIGGLSGGEEKDKFWRTVSLCTDLLPKEKPRYCMGVGLVSFSFLLFELNYFFLKKKFCS